MKIAVEGCAHGELDNIFDSIQSLENNENIKIDLLICCGDFQASRNMEDLRCMAVPPKYYNICSFYKYYNGEKQAPVLTIFIGGNHEASNYLQELPYGGWVAPNIYYMGYSNVINIAGIRIGGISGIYKGRDYLKGHFEKSPYDENTKRSVYHIRNSEIFKLKQISTNIPIDIFLSHDWPSGICDYGNVNQLLRFKPYFRDDIETGKLGSKPCGELLDYLKPTYWFAAHLHCKFAALVPHSDSKKTKFLALDKCLPKRRFLQIIDIPHDTNSKIEINYDLEWLTILNLTNHLLSVKSSFQYMPGLGSSERWCFTPTDAEKNATLLKFDQNLVVPNNFAKTAVGYDLEKYMQENIKQPKPQLNPQTTRFCSKLGIDDPLDILLKVAVHDDSSLLNSDYDTNPELSTFINDSDSEAGSDPSESCPNLSYNKGLSQPERDNQTVSSVENDGEIGLINTDESMAVETSSCSVDSPLHKKFKRRNADIYECG